MSWCKSGYKHKCKYWNWPLSLSRARSLFSDVLETYYHPTSFMRLSQTACQPLFEELLLVLQPLSLLTFNLDLLFQHHHLEPESHRPEIPSPPFPDPGSQLSTNETAINGSQSKTPDSRYSESLSEVDFGSPDHQAAKDAKSSPVTNSDNGGSAASTDTSFGPIKASVTQEETSPQLLWVQEKEIEDLPPPNVEEDSLAQQAGQVATTIQLLCLSIQWWLCDYAEINLSVFFIYR